jgi:hypothetical protein
MAHLAPIFLFQTHRIILEVDANLYFVISHPLIDDLLIAYVFPSLLSQFDSLLEIV